MRIDKGAHGYRDVRCPIIIELNSKGCVGVVGFKKVYIVQNRSCDIQK